MTPLRTLLGVALLALAASASAQVAVAPGATASAPYPPQRIFPAGSMQGRAVFGPGPSLRVNCIAYPLGPGLRALDLGQRLILTGQLAGLGGMVVFQRDAAGNVFRVWFMQPGDPSLSTVPAAPTACLFGTL